jgi:hypothetical protein
MKSRMFPAAKCILIAVVLAVVLSPECIAQQKAAAGAASPGASYYKVAPVFIPHPEPGKNWGIRQYGPVGIGIDLISPPFTIQISSVEKGSPAEATGKLKKGQIIESINGETLKDIDPRVQLARMLEKAEATDGLMKLKIKGEGEVVVTLPVLGAYSKTWPLNCPKSAKIVRNLGDKFAKLEKPDWTGGPFLLSTGEEKDFETYKRWIKIEVPTPDYPWYIGFYGTSVCEYYLKTGDQSVIPGINKMAAKLKASMYNGSWMGRGSEAPNYGYMGGGHMNAAGVHALNFLLLAKECGAEVDEYLLQRVLLQFFRFAGRGNVAYGDQLPEGGFRDNGKTAGLALAMSSAASLCPEGENSVYAAARDNSAMKSFYATTWFNRAHTGGGIGEIWHGVGMQLVAEKKPLQHRTFMDERKWFYELSRRFDGSFSLSDNGGSYDKPEWGNYFALAYTAARKKLRMFGAPKTEWCKTHTLPVRPWGTAADDVYYSLKPGEFAPGKGLDVSREVIATDASGPMMNRLNASNTTDEVLLMYAGHPDHSIRSGVAGIITRTGRNHLIVPLLKSKDPRMREVGVLTITGGFKLSPIPAEGITGEMLELLTEMINNPEESRWVAMGAMSGIAKGPADRIIPLVDRLLYFLKQDDWWTQSAALKPLATIAADERVYQKVLPGVGEMVAKNDSLSALWIADGLSKSLVSAKPEVQKLGLDVYLKTLAAIPDRRMAPGGANLASGARIAKSTVSRWIQSFPGGSDIVIKMPKMTSAWAASKKESDKYAYSGTFVSNKALAGKWKTVAMAKSAEDYQAQLVKQAEEEAKAKAKADADKQKGKKPAPPPKPKAPPKFGVGELVLQDGGKVGGVKGFIWSGDMLINSGSEEALKMEIKTVQGKEYLLVEAGGFSQTNEKIEDELPWNPNYYVMARGK